MRPKAGFCPRSGVPSCSWRKGLKSRWICWTKPPQPLRKGGSGRQSPREGRSVNQKLLGIAGIAVILLIAFVLSTNRTAIRLRIVGAAFALHAFIAWLVL